MTDMRNKPISFKKKSINFSILAQSVDFAIKQAYAITLNPKRVSFLSKNLRAFDTFSEATTPVKLQIIHHFLICYIINSA